MLLVEGVFSNAFLRMLLMNCVLPTRGGPASFRDARQDSAVPAFQKQNLLAFLTPELFELVSYRKQ
jgi:hypothetical protein